MCSLRTQHAQDGSPGRTSALTVRQLLKDAVLVIININMTLTTTFPFQTQRLVHALRGASTQLRPWAQHPLGTLCGGCNTSWRPPLALHRGAAGVEER